MRARPWGRISETAGLVPEVVKFQTNPLDFIFTSRQLFIKSPNVLGVPICVFGDCFELLLRLLIHLSQPLQLIPELWAG